MGARQRWLNEPDAKHVRVRRAAPGLTTGRRALGDTKSEAGKRFTVLPPFLQLELRLHLQLLAEKKPDGLPFVGARGVPFRRSTYGRKWKKARAKVGRPSGCRFYDHRHTGRTLATQSGATLKDTMVRAGHSSERVPLIYQHSTLERQRQVAAGIEAHVLADRARSDDDGGTSGTDRVNRSGQHTTPWSLTWGFVVERATGIEPAL
jgi:hypothetical protein